MSSKTYLLEQAKQAYDEERYEEVLQKLIPLLQKGIREPEIILLVGKSYYKAGNPYKAKEYFKELLKCTEGTNLQNEAKQKIEELNENIANKVTHKIFKDIGTNLKTTLQIPGRSSQYSSSKFNVNPPNKQANILADVVQNLKQSLTEMHQNKINKIESNPAIFSENKYLLTTERASYKIFFKRLDLRTKVTILAISLGVLPVVLVVTLAYYFANQSVTLQIQSEKQASALAIADKANRFLFERYGNIQTLASMPMFNDSKVSKLYSLRQKQDLLDTFSKTYGVYDNIALFNLNGDVSVQTRGKKLDNHSDRPYFQEVLRKNEAVISNPEISRYNEHLILQIACPIIDKNTKQIVGIMTAQVPVRHIEDLLRLFGVTGDQYYLVDERGKIFIAQQPQYLNQDAQVNFPNFNHFKADNQDGFTSGIYETADRVRALVVYVPFNKLKDLPQMDWGVLLVTETKIAEATQKQLLLTLLIGTTLTVLTVSILAIIISNRGTYPILTAVRAVQKLGQGDLETRISVKGSDELAVLGYNINLMAEQMQSMVQSQQIATEYAQQLSAMTVNLRNSMNLMETLEQVVKDLQMTLKVDRVIVCNINPATLKGKVLVEVVVGNWRQVKGISLENSELSSPDLLESYKNGQIDFIDDTSKNLQQSNYYLSKQQQVKGFAAKAMAIAPIVANNYLFGFLIAQHCAETHSWNKAEIDLFTNLTNQLCTAVEQLSLYNRLQEESSKAELARQEEQKLREQAIATAEEQRRQKEFMQSQLMELQNDIAVVSKGDLTVYSRVRDGEIGTVADFLNSIIESLRVIVIQVKSAVNHVNTSVLRDEEVVRNLANNAVLQTVEINETLDSVEQMTTSIQEVALNAHRAAEVASLATEAAELGQTAMSHTVGSVLALQETVAQTTNEVKRLGESSQHISNVVALINDIALQTNMLAVNAAIESARAGEEGNGFSLIAEEIAALAGRSRNATKEIEYIVQNIQSVTAQALSALERETTQIFQGTNLAANAKKGLGQLVDLSHLINDLVQSISQNTVAQAETSQAVTKLMRQIAQVSEHTVISSHQVSDSLQKNMEISQQLHVCVDKFKID